MSFAGCVVKRDHVDAAVILTRRSDGARFTKIEAYLPRNHVHRFRLDGPEDVDAEVKGWLAEAYEVGLQRHLRPRPQDRPVP
jgi:hypothetical protein